MSPHVRSKQCHCLVQAAAAEAAAGGATHTSSAISRLTAEKLYGVPPAHLPNQHRYPPPPPPLVCFACFVFFAAHHPASLLYAEKLNYRTFYPLST